jgi:hypothetical protein
MNIVCEDRERIFLDGSPEEWTALEQHATNCEVCQEEVRRWKALSTAAQELRDYTESPALWQRIESALVEQAAGAQPRKTWRDLPSFWRPAPVIWQTALASALAFALMIAAGYLYLHGPTVAPAEGDRLLKSAALSEVQRTENAYAKAIEKLESDTKPQLDNTNSSPLMASYREKLIVLDSAIDELRVQAGQNPSNAHLRHQLLAMYQEKQETLQEVLETK